VWGVNLLAALVFGAIHLPQAAAVIGLTVPVVGFVRLLNGVGGVAFGSLYWRRGLLAAMLAHISADIVLHVIGPMLPRGLMAQRRAESARGAKAAGPGLYRLEGVDKVTV
jgi:membrane protease YdiL (CAAX protease family)